jgi:hypothetical protein
MRRLLSALVVLVALLAPTLAAPTPARAADCQFVLGFNTLHNLIPATVGQCRENVHYDAQGNGVQATDGPTGQGGLLVWRKADNFTAFTDGYRTWVNGPFGLQLRLNSQRFAWEPNPEGLPVVGQTTPPVGVAAPSETTSRNWSGYIALGGTFTAVSGTWTVAAPRNRGIASASGTWVGIGGVNSRDLIQAGTEDVNLGNGEVRYDAWIETLPQAAVVVPLTVRPGDSVTVSIVARSNGRWSIALQNNTTGRSYETIVAYDSSFSSAEWIQEAPFARRQLAPLDDFGSVAFSAGSTVRNGQTLSLAAVGAMPVTMVDAADNPIAVPSALGGDGSFSVQRVGL